MAENVMMECALIYAAHGFPVFPLIGKRPAVKRPFHVATTDPEDIEAWWYYEQVRYNIGIPTGQPSGIWVLDVDNKPGGENGFRTLQSIAGDFNWAANVPFQRSSSGGHFFFKCDDDGIGINAGQIGPGVDVRGNGGYIVAAPSVHPDTGKRYFWKDDRSIVSQPVKVAPDWLLELAKRRETVAKPEVPVRPCTSAMMSSSGTIRYPAYGQKALAEECQNIKDARRGSQGHTLNRAAFKIGKLIAKGALEEFEAEMELKISASRMVNYDQRHPWAKTEIDRIIEKAISDGKTA